MIVSYETLRTLEEELAQCPIGLLLADEGHRLKNAGKSPRLSEHICLLPLDTLTFQALTKLNVQRRVILTGTPIQNDLSEYFALLNFANPEYLGTKMDFKKNFESKILRGRDADASDKVKLESDAKLKELGGLVSKFIIRRTNDLLSKYRELAQIRYSSELTGYSTCKVRACCFLSTVATASQAVQHLRDI
jgi:DNA repair and recombination RAD54-like protein